MKIDYITTNEQSKHNATISITGSLRIENRTEYCQLGNLPL